MPAEPQTTSQSLGEAAAAYTARGLKVFPLHGIVAHSRTGELRCSCAEGSSCPSPGKHPLERLAPHGSHDATDDTIVVAEWWQIAPYANVAVATGTALDGGPSRLGVVDVDSRHNGFASLRALVAATPEAKDAWVAIRGAPRVATGGGGAHLYVATPERANSAGAAGTDREGVDFRGSGGYVVAPPSRHISGGHYRWITPLGAATLPPLPGPLAEWLKLPVKPPVSSGTSRTRSHLDEVADPLARRRLGAYRDAVVAGTEELIATAPNGRQHAALFTASCRLFDLARAGLIAHDEARGLLMAAGSRMATFDPKSPWSQTEISHHVDSSWTPSSPSRPMPRTCPVTLRPCGLSASPLSLVRGRWPKHASTPPRPSLPSRCRHPSGTSTVSGGPGRHRRSTLASMHLAVPGAPQLLSSGPPCGADGCHVRATWCSCAARRLPWPRLGSHPAGRPPYTLNGHRTGSNAPSSHRSKESPRCSPPIPRHCRRSEMVYDEQGPDGGRTPLGSSFLTDAVAYQGWHSGR